MTSRERMKRKAVEDVLDAEARFKDADSTTGAHTFPFYERLSSTDAFSYRPVY